jgi:hypothetical protein
MTDLDRELIVELLGRLGAADDASVLQAARELHGKVSQSGLTWDDIVRLHLDAAGADAETEHSDASAADDVQPDDEAAPSPADKGEVARLIDRLLARKNLSDTMREDLAEMKRALGEGDLDEMDRRYLRALAKRLGA